jgi:glycine dehydrogenase subunit 1
MMRYLPHTPEEIDQMLAVVGQPSVDALFDASIPEKARLGRPLEVGAALDEPALMRHLESLAGRNTGATLTSFLGAGAYDHHIPPAVDQLLLRSEFYTAYTPYQPEVSQGTLQGIFEFQTIVSELFGLPLANASMYDGASSAAEAVLMARRLTKRDHVLLSESVHPEYREVVETYLRSIGAGDQIRTIPMGADGLDDAAAIAAAIDDQTAVVLLGYPTFFGTVSDVRAVVQSAHERGALVVTATSEPYALALLESPGALGVDIAVGEGQPIATTPQFGGPGVGLFACRESREMLQQIPGRLCGQTVDRNGKVGYVLTLVTREQFIRRERATSNICTNQGLLALALTIRVALLGKRGFIETAQQCLAKTEYLKAEIAKIPGFSLVYPQARTFNEVAIQAPSEASAVLERLVAKGFLGGYDLGRSFADRKNQLLVAVTERHTRDDLDGFLQALASS